MTGQLAGGAAELTPLLFSYHSSREKGSETLRVVQNMA